LPDHNGLDLPAVRGDGAVGPLPGEPVAECERKPRECDVLICIVEHRYGFEPENGRVV